MSVRNWRDPDNVTEKIRRCQAVREAALAIEHQPGNVVEKARDKESRE